MAKDFDPRRILRKISNSLTRVCFERAGVVEGIPWDDLGETQVEPAPSSGNIDDLEEFGRDVDDGAERSFLPDGGDSPDDIAGDSLRQRRISHGHSLDTQGRRHRLEIERPADRNHPDREATGAPNSGVDEEGLEDLLRGQPESSYCLQAEAASRRVVLVAVSAERDSSRGESHDGWGRSRLGAWHTCTVCRPRPRVVSPPKGGIRR